MTMNRKHQLLRRWRREDYRLDLYDTGRNGAFSRPLLGYRFCYKGQRVFSGEDFSPSPLYAIDSDKALGSLLGFLSLKPGDTDPDYFADYSIFQLEFVAEHGDALSMYAEELEHRKE